MSWFSKGKKETNMETAHHMEKSVSGIKTARDPVCGMDVNTEKAAATSVYQGKTYYFCNPGCKKTFDANPAKYVTGAARGMPARGGHCM